MFHLQGYEHLIFLLKISAPRGPTLAGRGGTHL